MEAYILQKKIDKLELENEKQKQEINDLNCCITRFFKSLYQQNKTSLQLKKQFKINLN